MDLWDPTLLMIYSFLFFLVNRESLNFGFSPGSKVCFLTLQVNSGQMLSLKKNSLVTVSDIVDYLVTSDKEHRTIALQY